MPTTTEIIRALNDELRTRQGGAEFLYTSGQVCITRGVATRGPDFMLKAVHAVRTYSDFAASNQSAVVPTHWWLWPFTTPFFSWIIGAVGNNARGVTGICWNAKIMILRAFDASGSATVADTIEAMDYARQNGAKVINASYSDAQFSQAEHDAIDAAVHAIGRDARFRDIVVHARVIERACAGIRRNSPACSGVNR